MASNTDALTQFFLRTIDGWVQDAASKNQKIPVSSFRFEADEVSGRLYGADYFKYLVTGRGPGKFPPPDKMTEWVEANPDVLARAKQVFKYLTAQQLGYLIGRKIAREGTDIFQGKKPGIDMLGVMDKNMVLLLEELAKNEAIKIGTDLKAAFNEQLHPADI